MVSNYEVSQILKQHSHRRARAGRLTHFMLVMDKPSNQGLNDAVLLHCMNLSLGCPSTPIYVLILATVLTQSNFIK